MAPPISVGRWGCHGNHVLFYAPGPMILVFTGEKSYRTCDGRQCCWLLLLILTSTSFFTQPGIILHHNNR